MLRQKLDNSLMTVHGRLLDRGAEMPALGIHISPGLDQELNDGEMTPNSSRLERCVELAALFPHVRTLLKQELDDTEMTLVGRCLQCRPELTSDHIDLGPIFEQQFESFGVTP